MVVVFWRGRGEGRENEFLLDWVREFNLLAGCHYIQYSLFCVLGGHGAMAPTSTPPHIPSLHSITAAGSLPTTGRQTNCSRVITHAAGKGIIVVIKLCAELILLLCIAMTYRYYKGTQKPS